MSSPFATRLAAVGAPLGTRHNGESITLSNADDVSATVKAIVEIDDVTSDAEGFDIITGLLLIETATVLRKVASLGTVILARARGEQWHVFDKSGDRNGFTRFNIRRRHQEQTHANLYDLHGKQIPFSE